MKTSLLMILALLMLISVFGCVGYVDTDRGGYYDRDGRDYRDGRGDRDRERGGQPDKERDRGGDRDRDRGLPPGYDPRGGG